jgi:antirestriction protein ArdC
MLPGTDKKTGEPKMIPLLKGWTVWNVAHFSGLELPERPPTLIIGGGIEGMESQYQNPPKIEHVPSAQAYYSPLFDRITLPLRDQFTSEMGYAETKAHELVHSTGHSSRLKRFEDTDEPHTAYAREELAAEIGAAIMLQRLGLKPDMRRVAGYVRGWASVIKDDPNMLIGAANRADKAVNMVLNIEQEQVEEVAA